MCNAALRGSRVAESRASIIIAISGRGLAVRLAGIRAGIAELGEKWKKWTIAVLNRAIEIPRFPIAPRFDRFDLRFERGIARDRRLSRR